MDDVIFSGTSAPSGPQYRRSDDLHRQLAPARAPAEFNDARHARSDAPHRARGGLGLPHQRPRGARPRRAHPVRGCRHRRALAGAGAPGPDRRAGQCQAASSAAASWRTPPASPACTAAATRPSCASSAAEGNLARLNDILGQLNSQIESLKRQARQARRYKEISAEIRKLDAVVLHLRWAEAQAQVEARRRISPMRWRRSGAPPRPSPRR